MMNGWPTIRRCGLNLISPSGLNPQVWKNPALMTSKGPSGGVA